MATLVSSVQASGGNYATMALFEADKQNDSHVTAGDTLVAEVSGTVTGGFIFAGWTEDPTAANPVIIRAKAGEECEGIPGNGAILEHTGAWGLLFGLQQSYLQLENIEFRASAGNTRVFEMQSGGDNLTATGCIFNCSTSNTANNVAPKNTGNAFIKCLFNGGSNALTSASAGQPVKLYGCGFTNATTGLVSSSQMDTRNCFSYGCTTDYSTTTTHANSTNNATDKTGTTTVPGSNPVGDLVTGDFTNTAGLEFYLATGSALDDAGSDLSAEYTTDILGVAITGTYPIGFYFLAAAGGNTVTVGDLLGFNESSSVSVTSSVNDTLNSVETVPMQGSTQIADFTKLISILSNANVTIVSDQSNLIDNNLPVTSTTVVSEILRLISQKQVNALLSIVDTSNFITTVTVLKQITKTVSEQLKLSDTTNITASLNVLEKLKAIASSSVTVQTGVVQDFIKGLDNVTVITGVLVIINEFLNISEALVNFQIDANVSDSTNITAGIQTGALVSNSDILSFADSILKGKILTISDQLKVSEQVTTLAALIITVNENLKGIDNVSPISVSLTLNEKLLTSENVSIVALLNVFEALGAKDLVIQFDSGNNNPTVTFKLDGKATTFKLDSR